MLLMTEKFDFGRIIVMFGILVTDYGEK